MSAGSARLELSPVLSSSELREAVRRRAEEIYVRSGMVSGRDLQNWTQAEAEILREFAGSTRHAAIIVELDGVQYVGEYGSQSHDGYQPGEFSPGQEIPLRFEGNKMFLARPNGKELETTVVRKIG